ncbi:MAG: fructose-bisphosphate aldolase class I [Candidatus Eremiobacteraeota bacterium]|nr:fructose-bisphosphate aldolase class I [Candidatus Eremiobacteraeota bacterium]
MNNYDLVSTANAMVAPGKGILAMDESNNTCNKRFEKLGIETTPERRRAYREVLLTTPRLGDWISGAILYDETIRQSTSRGAAFVEIIQDAGVLVGIKVDAGTVPLPGTDGELVTEGLDGLQRRVEEYRGMGARFAKWRAVIGISQDSPTQRALAANAQALARYAKTCQVGGIVPIVEPEVLSDGTHDLERCATATRAALLRVFEALVAEDVDLRAMVLKPNMVTPGMNAVQGTVESVAQATVDVLAQTVPAAVAGIAFLSGGQDDVLATRHLQAMNELPQRYRPWPLTFSFGRAIQQNALVAWRDDPQQVERAQSIIAQRSRCNAAASTGSYSPSFEQRSEPVAV